VLPRRWLPAGTKGESGESTAKNPEREEQAFTASRKSAQSVPSFRSIAQVEGGRRGDHQGGEKRPALLGRRRGGKVKGKRPDGKGGGT